MIMASIAQQWVLVPRILAALEFPRKNGLTLGAYHLTEKSVWGVESIMVSDLPVYVEMPHPLGFEFKKRANLCSVSLEPRRNREIG